MKKDSKEWYNSGWLQTVVGALILPPIADRISDHTKGIPVIAPIVQFLKFVWTDILNFELPLYVTILVLIAVFIGVRNYLKFQDGLKEIYDNLPPKVDFLSFTKGKFKKWVWVWKWQLNSKSNTYYIYDLEPICDKCGFKMYQDPGYAVYICPNCDNRYAGYYELSSDIEKVIHQKIDRGEYPK